MKGYCPQIRAGLGHDSVRVRQVRMQFPPTHYHSSTFFSLCHPVRSCARLPTALGIPCPDPCQGPEWVPQGLTAPGLLAPSGLASADLSQRPPGSSPLPHALHLCPLWTHGLSLGSLLRTPAWVLFPLQLHGLATAGAQRAETSYTWNYRSISNFTRISKPLLSRSWFSLGTKAQFLEKGEEDYKIQVIGLHFVFNLLPFCQDRCTVCPQIGTGPAIPSLVWCHGWPQTCSSSHTWGMPSAGHSGHNGPVSQESQETTFKPNQT